MTAVIRPSVLIAVLVAPLLFAAAPAQAPDHHEVPMLELNPSTPIEWDAAASEFVVRMSAKWGLVAAGARAGFTIRVTIEITESSAGLLAELGPVNTPIRADGERGAQGMVPIEPALIPWDRLGGTFEGTVDLTVTAQAQNSKGKDVGGSVVASDPGFGIVKGG